MDESAVLTDPMIDQVLDGNAAAGMLATAFGSDMTTVAGRCAHCAAVNPVARLRAYVRGPGVVLRCPVCASVVIRIVETPRGTMVDVHAASMRFDRS